jgi:S-adenosylmethionine hydrolase
VLRPPRARGSNGAVAAPLITFLSDYGLDDEFVGICHGVIARACPQAQVIDVTHGISRHDVRAGALALRAALPFVPAGVHLAVVDPEVGARRTQRGGPRRAVALRTVDEQRLLVGPDNGLLVLAAERFGGAEEAVDIGRSRFRLEPVSQTFHGRDIFAPVAAALACGEPLAAVGDPVAVDELTGLELPVARVQDGVLVAHALTIDRFGNVALNVDHELLATFGLRLGASVVLRGGPHTLNARYAATFADVEPGALLVYEDAQRMLAVAINRGSAAAVLGIERDDELRIAPA